MPFSFVNPALLWGLAGVGIPLLVHLLGRRKGRERRFAAMDFLLASERRLAARRRVRNLLLLLVRTALILAVSLALARPLLRGASAVGAEPPVSAVAVLDRTASLRARTGGVRLFDRAEELLREALDRLPAGSEVAVITLDRTSARLTPGFVQVPQALAALGAVEPGFAAGKAAPALAAARSTLEGAHRERRLILVASDLQRSTWTAGEALLEEAADVAVLDAAAEGIPPDAGLVRGRVVPGPEPRVEGEAIRSAGVPAGGVADLPAGEALVRLVVAGEAANRGFLRFGRERRASVTLALPAEVPAGAIAYLDLLEGGSLDADDRFYVRLERPRLLRVLVANGAPSADLYQDEVFYLDRALESEPGRFLRRVVDASRGRLGSLADLDVVVLANVGRLDAGDARALAGFVSAGGGLLVTAGDRVDPLGLERALGPLLPARPRAILAARVGEPPITIAPPGASPHPVLAPLDASASLEALEAVRVARLLAVDPLPGAQVVLVYSNTLPAIVLGRHGEGRTALLTTTIDRDWTDLPVRPGYLPTLTRLALHLGGALAPDRRREWTAGDRVAIEVDEGEEAGPPPRVEAPDGRVLETVQSGPRTFELERADEPGLYRVRRGDRTETALDFVVNVDPAECDLQRASGAEVRALAGERAQVGGAAPGKGHERETSLPLLAVAALAFALEPLLARSKAAPEPELAAMPAMPGSGS